MVVASFARRPAGLLVLCLTTGCVAAGTREQQFVQGHIEGLPAIEFVRVSCGGGFFAGSHVCATVAMAEGMTLQFLNLGYQSFASAPSRVRVAAAGGRAPLVVSCTGQSGFADVDRAGLFGHHFSPAIDRVADAIRRRRDVIEQLEFWPQCPQFWEVQEKDGPAYRYCAHAAGQVGVPPPRPCG